ncbi:MAG: hypothetical protein AAGK04_06915 [Planctomycetota bacterium]
MAPGVSQTAQTPGSSRHAGPDRAAGPAPLWAIGALTFIGSLGTGLVTNGIGFLAQSALGYADRGNYGLHLALGLAYILGALGVSPALRAMSRRSRRVTTRSVLIGVLVAIAAVCQLPLVSALDGGPPTAWSLWAMVVVFAPLTGALWPIVESYLSGGRQGRELRHAVGGFNIVWASAVAVSFWISAPLLAASPLTLIALLGVAHALAIPIVIFMGAEPGRHLADEPHRVDPVDRRLLTVFRVLLPTSYIVASSLLPFLPETLARLGVAAAWTMPIASTWMIVRVGVFTLMQRWHGWRHAPWAPIVGAGLLLVGFAIAVGTRTLDAGGVGPIALLIGGLASFGAGMAVIYAAALYYAMEVGAAEVDAGGVHEALIGVGYTTGPLLGLLALTVGGLPDADQTPIVAFETLLIGMVSVVAVGATLVAFGLAWRRPFELNDESDDKPDEPNDR